MSTNAFFTAYNNIQNAIAAPEREAEERRLRQAEAEMRRSEFEARRQAAEREAAMKASQDAQARARFGFRAGSMYPGAPQQVQQPQPMTQPAMQIQAAGPMPPAPQFDANGREIEQVQVTAQARGPMPTQEDEATFMMRDAFNRASAGDPYAVEQFNQLFEQKRQTMSEEEKRIQAGVAGYAGQILRMPREQRPQAVMMALQQLGVDPSMTQIDDYLQDPDKLEQALRFEMVMGNPSEANEAAIGVDADMQKQMNEQRYEPVRAIDLNDRTVLYGGPGNEVASFRQGVDPTQARGQDLQMQAARIRASSAERVAGINANTRLTIQERQSALAREERNLKRELARMGAPAGADSGLSASEVQWNDDNQDDNQSDNGGF